MQRELSDTDLIVQEYLKRAWKENWYETPIITDGFDTFIIYGLCRMGGLSL